MGRRPADGLTLARAAATAVTLTSPPSGVGRADAGGRIAEIDPILNPDKLRARG